MPASPAPADPQTVTRRVSAVLDDATLPAYDWGEPLPSYDFAAGAATPQPAMWRRVAPAWSWRPGQGDRGQRARSSRSTTRRTRATAKAGTDPPSGDGDDGDGDGDRRVVELPGVAASPRSSSPSRHARGIRPRPRCSTGCTTSVPPSGSAAPAR